MNLKRNFLSSSFILLGCVLFAQHTDPTTNVDGITKGWYEQIQTNLLKQEYSLHLKKDKHYRAFNRSNNIIGQLRPGAMNLTPKLDSGQTTVLWQAELETASIVFDNHLVYTPTQTALITLDKNIVEYHHGKFTEQYINNEQGLRQNFIIHEGPQSNTIQVNLNLKGLKADKRNETELAFYNQTPKGGIQAYTLYKDLKSWDANGIPLASHFEVMGNQVSLVVNTQNATYPITVDPIITNSDTILEENQKSAQFGYSVSSAGDVNGDGYDDVIVGAPYYDKGQKDEGAAFVYHGSSLGVSIKANVVLERDQAAALFGYSVSSAGDVNGDGYDDVIIGSPYYDNRQLDEGLAFVYYGSKNGLSNYRPYPQLKAFSLLEENQVGSFYGGSVSGAGDVNSDGYDDIIVGWTGWHTFRSTYGAAMIYYGTGGGITTVGKVILKGGNQTGVSGFGCSVSSAGDFNGDGYDDIAIGEYGYSTYNYKGGAAHIYLGSSSGILASKKSVFTHASGGNIGNSVSLAGDVNGDGYDDVIIGNYNGKIGSGQGYVHIYYGNKSISNSSQIDTPKTSTFFGKSVSSAGDVNGDGYDDVIIGAEAFDNGQLAEGAAFIYYGSSKGIDTTIVFQIEKNQAYAYLGCSVSSAGDVNGDGYDDVIIGARYYDKGENNEGIALIYTSLTSSTCTTTYSTDTITSCGPYTWTDGKTYTTSNNTAKDTFTNAAGCDSIVTLKLTIPSSNHIQIGSDIDGEAADDRSGYSVSISGDGNIIAIGGHHNDENGSNSGHVRVFKNNRGTWTQIGSDIDGEASDDNSGNFISLSSDGNTLAIGAYLNDGNGSNSGHVRVYRNNNNTWTQIGSDIDGEKFDDYFGSSISMSSDGNIVAIGAIQNDGNGSNSGHVRVYRNNNSTWTQIGSDIDGEATNDRSGKSVSMSGDGSIVAIGATYNDGNGTDAGHVRVYRNNSGTWTQIGSDIDGEAANDRFGSSVSMNSNGSIIAIGAVHNDGNGSNAGHVRIFENINSVWTQIGSDIDGEATLDRFGSSVSMSSDGSIVAIGANANGDSAQGHVRIYENTNGAWTQVGSDIDGEGAYDNSGNSISVSSDGSIVAIGALYNNDNGKYSGHVRVYQVGSLYGISYSTDTINSCGPYTWTDGKTYTASNNTAKDTFTNAAGCDSIVTLNLRVRTDTTITNNIKLKLTWLKQQQKNLGLRVNGIDTNQWHYIAITKSSNRIGKVYIDGILSDSGLFDNVNYTYSKLNIGAAYRTSYYRFYKGWLDELRVSKVVRTSTEIANHYKSGQPFSVDNNTFGLWHFDETSGNKFANSVSGSGDLFNGPVFTNGKFSNAVYFDGVNDRGDCNVDIPEDNITIEFWVKPDGFPSNQGGIVQPYGLYNMDVRIQNYKDTVISNSKTYSTDTITSCGLYTWTDGKTYTSSNSTAKDTFTNAVGCDSIVTLNLTILPYPAITGNNIVCIGSTIKLTGSGVPYNGSIPAWQSSNPSVATVSGSTGVVTGISTGTATVTYTDSNGCSTTHSIIVPPLPTVSGQFSICEFNTTKLTGSGAPSNGSIPAWQSSNPSVATVSGSIGIVTGLSAGTTLVTYTDSNTCSVTQVITVLPSTYDTLTFLECDSVISPTGRVYTSTGSYNDTLVNSYGCDSVITSLVTIGDTISPTVLTQNVNLYLNQLGQVSTSSLDVNNGSSDNCGITSYRLSDSIFDCTDVGTNTIYLIVTDRYGNIESASAVVTVQDTIKPTVLTQNVTVSLDASGAGSVTVADIDNGSTDNCWIASRTLSKTNFDCSEVGSNTIYLIITDVNGNIDSASAVVTVQDTIKPTLLTQNVTVSLDASGAGSVTVADIDNGSTDNCSIASRTLSKSSFDCSEVGANTIYLVVTDVNGNIDSASAVVTVQDTIKPTLLTQNVTVSLDASGAGSVTVADIDNGSTDNCSIASRTLSKSSFDCSEVGANTIWLRVTDVNGNIDSASAVVTVQDTIKPTVLTQNVTVSLDASGAGSVTVSDIDNGSTDNCTIATRTLSKSSFDCSEVGANTIYLIVKDINGNIDSASAVVTVQDIIKPTVLTQNVTVSLDASGAGSVTLSDIDNGSTDNCTIATRTLSKSSFDCSEVGANTIYLIVTDINGNIDSASAVVTVQDTIKPTVLTQNVTFSLDASGAGSVTVSDIDNGSTDNCTIATRTLSKSSFDCSNVGANTIWLRVTDVNGNIDSASAVVTVQDIIKPTVVTTPSDIALGYCDATHTYAIPTGDDNCGVTVTQIAGLPPGSTFPVGLTLNSFEISDPSGNTVTTSFTVDIRARYMPFAISDTSICNNNNKIDLSKGFDNIIFIGSGVEANEKFFNPNSLVPGSYSITAEFTDSMGCVSTEQFVMEIRSTPIVPRIKRVASDQIVTVRAYNNYQWYRNGEELEGEDKQLLRVHELGIYSVLVGNDENCFEASEGYGFGIPVNEENVTNQGLVKVFPNPTRDMVFVQINDEVESHLLTLADAVGNKLIEQETSTKVVKLDLTSLAPGTYYLNVAGTLINETVVIVKN